MMTTLGGAHDDDGEGALGDDGQRVFRVTTIGAFSGDDDWSILG